MEWLCLGLGLLYHHTSKNAELPVSDVAFGGASFAYFLILSQEKPYGLSILGDFLYHLLMASNVVVNGISWFVLCLVLSPGEGFLWHVPKQADSVLYKESHHHGQGAKIL